MKRLFLLVFILSISFSIKAQNEKTQIHLYGFLRNEFYYDSYKGVDAAMDQFYLVPLYTGEDSNGNHYNEQGSANLSAIATRFGTNITGPKILGAIPTANVEIDFAGITTKESQLFRIRKAYLKLDWEKSSLLVGQDWHPFYGKEYPTVAPLNTGAPFQPFNRSPMVRYEYKSGKFMFLGAAIYENQYVSKGFTVYSTSNSATLPKRDAIIPELVAGAYYYNTKLALGVAAQYNAIKPIDRTTGSEGIFVSDELNTSMAAMAFIKYKTDGFYLLAKYVIGQNLANLTMPGGYGVKSIDSATGAYTYTNYNNYTAFINAVYGKSFQVGLFLGYGKNLGTSDPLALNAENNVTTAGMFTNIQDMMRIAPHVSYNVKNFRFIAEYERTSATYGIGSINTSNGLYNSFKSVANNRVIFVLMYFFNI